MKILVVVGSGTQNGNTDQLADAFVKGAEEAGHTVKKVFLGSMHLQFCTGCSACRLTGGLCVRKDDMQQLYPEYTDCNMVVLASPLYYWSVSAILKNFIDRLHCLPKAGRALDRPIDCALLMTAREKDCAAYEPVIAYYRHLVSRMGWQDRGMVLATDCGGIGKEGRLIGRTGFLEKGYEFGRSL